MNAIAKIKRIVRDNVLFKFLWERYICKLLLMIDPKILANMTYRSRFNKNIDWENPKNLIEKIYWLQMYSDTRLWTLCADKYKVRQYVEEKACGHILNELYGVWTDVENIDWDKLPNRFVMKCNNGCGQVIVVKDKSNLNIPFLKKQLKAWMTEKYGYEGAQLHYLGINSCIIAEKLLENQGNLSLIDYKLWCFHGKPEFFLVAYDRKNAEEYKLSAFDLNWTNISEKVLNKETSHFCGKDIPMPNTLMEMIDIATKLSQDFCEVRVDFYEVDGQVVFGELTFTSGYGSYNEDYYLELGNKLDLNKVKKIDIPNKYKKFIIN